MHLVVQNIDSSLKQQKIVIRTFALVFALGNVFHVDKFRAMRVRLVDADKVVKPSLAV